MEILFILGQILAVVVLCCGAVVSLLAAGAGSPDKPVPGSVPE